MRWLLIIFISFLFMACGDNTNNQISAPLKATFITPAAGLTENAQIIIEFSNAIDPQSVTETSCRVMDINNNIIEGVRNVSEKVLTFSIAGNFSLNETYKVVLTTDIKDIDGNNLLNETTQDFLIISSDTSAPVILSSSVETGSLLNKARISVLMSEILNPLTVRPTTLQLYDNTNTLVDGNVSEAQGLLTFTPKSELLETQTYTLIFEQAVEDMSGNASSVGQSYQFNLRTSVDQGRFLKIGNVLDTNMSVNDVLVEGNTMYIASADSMIGIFSLASFPTLIEHSRLNLDSQAISIQKSGNNLFVSTSKSGLIVIDATDLSSPTIISSLDNNASIFNMHLVDTNLYMASTDNGVQVVDISNPLLPTLSDTIMTSESAFDVFFMNTGVSYVADKRAGLSLVDTSIENSGILRTLPTRSITRKLLVHAGVLYVANSILGVDVYNIGDPLNPVHLKTIPTLSYAFDLYHANDGINDYLYVADKEKGVRVFDINNPTDIVPIAQLSSTNRVFSLAQYNSMLLIGEDTGRISTYTLFPDLVAPSVSQTQPLSGAVDVAFNEVVSIVFTEDIVLTDINSSLTFTDGDFNNISFTPSYDSQRKTLFLQADQNLSSGSEYIVSLVGEVKDKAGNSMQNLPYSFSFTTKIIDTTPPRIISSSPTNGSTVTSVSFVVVGFSEEMDTSTMVASNFSLTDNTSRVYTGSYSYTNSVLTFQPDITLFSDRTYDFNVSGQVSDLAGNLLGSDQVIGFDIVVVNAAPFVSSTIPAQDATVTSNFGDITITFSEAMDASSFIANTTVTSPNGINSINVLSPTQIQVAVGFSTPPETIQLNITTGVKDSSGKNMAAPFTLTYTTSGSGF